MAWRITLDVDGFEDDAVFDDFEDGAEFDLRVLKLMLVFDDFGNDAEF